MPDDPQISLFDLLAAKTAKEAAMSEVEDHADVDWKEAALDAVERAAIERPFLTADDVMERIDPAAETHELRALGPVMLRAAKQGWIEKSNNPALLCKRRSRHAAPLTVWRSLLYRRPVL